MHRKSECWSCLSLVPTAAAVYACMYGCEVGAKGKRKERIRSSAKSGVNGGTGEAAVDQRHYSALPAFLPAVSRCERPVGTRFPLPTHILFHTQETLGSYSPSGQR